jgi:hypothetical protein
MSTLNAQTTPGKWIIFIYGDLNTTIVVDSAAVRQTIAHLIDSLSTAGVSGRTYIGSYSSNSTRPGAAFIDSTSPGTGNGKYLMQFPNFDSEIIQGETSFSNSNSSDSAQLYVYGNNYAMYITTAPTYLESVTIMTQWSAKDTSVQKSLLDTPPLSSDSGYVFHITNSGTHHYLNIFKRSRDDGFGFGKTDAACINIRCEQLPDALLPTAGTSAVVKLNVRLRRKCL